MADNYEDICEREFKERKLGHSAAEFFIQVTFFSFRFT